MSRLFTYIVTHDTGAAPNPYWKVCTLVIGKPAIRRMARKGDWIVGLGSKADGKDDHIVYAMKVTDVMTMEAYDEYCAKMLKGKIPNWKSMDYRECVGDCIYAFRGKKKPNIRDSVHDDANRLVDLGGVNALLSARFYYFGDYPVQLPEELLSIKYSGKRHKVDANEPYVERFAEWISTFQRNTVYGDPQLKKKLSDPETLAALKAHDLQDDYEETT